MKISELATATSVSVHRLRRYEAAGLLSSQRQANGYRDYQKSVVREVKFIAMAREIGFPLDTIAEYLPRFRTGTLQAHDLVDAIAQRVQQIDAAIAAQKALKKQLLEHSAWIQAKSTTQRKRTLI
jgi:MerR family transcriptional regulator, copper efflux regulator